MPGAGSGDTFAVTPRNADDAIVMQVFCVSSDSQSGVEVSAPGWTIAELDGMTGNTGTSYWVATFGAIAPSSTTSLVTVAWSTACQLRFEIADEFTGNDPTGGATTFEASAQNVGMGSCAASVTTRHAGDAIWAACVAPNATLATGSGYVRAAAIGNDGLSELAITRDPSGTSEMAIFDSSQPYANAMSEVAISPRAAAAP